MNLQKIWKDLLLMERTTGTRRTRHVLADRTLMHVMEQLHVPHGDKLRLYLSHRTMVEQ